MACWSVVALAILNVAMVNADCYLHIPRGSNNRLNEGNRERNNANRLFDSQNNDRGGYNKGGSNDDKQEPMKYVIGSTLNIEWTTQHQCGLENTKCDVIVQYMCDNSIRDGRSTNRISEEDDDLDKGRHESHDHYKNCKSRERNQGLYTADQDLDGKAAIYTRQNPNGGRSGLECPEERDYYPYWAPSPWKDIVIMTDSTEKCKYFKDESQNKKAKGYCSFLDSKTQKDAIKDRKNNKKGLLAPLTEAACKQKDQEKYKWVEAPAHNIDKPDCVAAPRQRDNHLGNSPVGGEGSENIPQTASYAWVVPNTPGAKCAFRMRYNISVLDYVSDKTFSADDDSVDIGSTYGLDKGEAKERGYEMENNPNIRPLKTEDGIQKKLKLQLAINTAQTGRVFQDRSHRFQIVERNASIPSTAKIHNLNTRGRRGNIVQLYPAVEYDFSPNVLQVKTNDYIHVQWTGSLTNPSNDDGEGKNKEDKNNMINLKPDSIGNFNGGKGKHGYPGNSYPQPIGNDRFLALHEDIARQAALPLHEDETPTYYKDPCGTTTRDEVATNLRDEIRDISVLLNDTLRDLREVELYRNRRSLTTSDDKDKSSNVIDDYVEKEMTEASEEDLEDIEQPSTVLQDPASRRRRRRRRRRRGGSTTTPAATCDNPSSSRRRRSSTRRRGRAILDNSPEYVDLGPLQATESGEWYYMCTRNNNFSNRSQKGKIIVKE